MKKDAIYKDVNVASKGKDSENEICNEEDFKNSCSELIYNEIAEHSIGQYVTKELVFSNSEKQENGSIMFICGATEDFCEDLDFYQHTYRIYRVNDYRIQKEFPIENKDIMRIYGIIDSVTESYRTGLYIPTINIYYADYIRQYGEDVETAKTDKEIEEERRKIEEENQIKDSINSDYNGMTKNIDNMDALSLDEFIVYCDAMNFQDIVARKENLSKRFVKIHVQVTDHKIFSNDESKENYVGGFSDPNSVQDDVWYFKIYNERIEEYVYPMSNRNNMYFLSTDCSNASTLTENEAITVYGQIENHNIEDGKFEILVRHFEIE